MKSYRVLYTVEIHETHEVYVDAKSPEDAIKKAEESGEGSLVSGPYIVDDYHYEAEEIEGE